MIDVILVGIGMVFLGLFGIRQISKYNAKKYAEWDSGAACWKSAHIPRGK